MSKNGHRPLRARSYTWNQGRPDAQPGVLVRGPSGQRVAHLTIEEARRAADEIHAACDTAEQQQEYSVTAPSDLPEFLTGPDFGARIRDLESLTVGTNGDPEKEAK